jgi:hypothetical protein
MMEKTLADFVDNEIMPQHWSLYRLAKYVCGRRLPIGWGWRKQARGSSLSPGLKTL